MRGKSGNIAVHTEQTFRYNNRIFMFGAMLFEHFFQGERNRYGHRNNVSAREEVRPGQ